MTKAEIRKRPAEAIASILGAAVIAVIMATGVLTLVLVTVAAMRETSLSRLIDEILPRFRGGPTEVPALGYVVFVIYVIATSSTAVAIRRRLTRR